MPIPNYQIVMLPLLRLLGDQNEHTLVGIVSTLENEFNLTDDETLEMLPSGKVTKFRSRVGWAKTYLKKAGLLDNEARGSYKITARGLDVLKRNPETIDNELLKEFPEFVEWVDADSKQDEPERRVKVPEPIVRTPDERLFEAYLQIRRNVASEILDTVYKTTPIFFEKLVVDLLVKMGYGGSFQEASSRLTRSTGDEGIDGIINEDRLGLDVIYVQAKRWTGNVSRPEIQKFAGALQGKRAKKGVFITTSDFTREARDFAANIENKIILINGDELSSLMIDYNVGVSTIGSYEIKRIDSDYFVEE